MKFFKAMMAVCLACVLSACSKPQYTQTDITVDELIEMEEKGEDFILLVERDQCPFCEALNEYIQETKQDHPDVKVYRIDTTNFDLKKVNQEDKTLVSTSEEGQKFLKEIPYFLYTPAIYRYEDGVAKDAGLGFGTQDQTVSLWDVDSTVDFDTAKTVPVWDYLEGKE